MTFNSYVFLFVFLPNVLAIYSVLREPRFVNWFLSAASLVFYSFAGPIYLVPLLFTCVFDYIIGRFDQSFGYREKLPKTPAGKVNRKVLREREAGASVPTS